MSRLVLLSLLIYGLVLLGLATLRGEVLALALPPIVYLGAGLLYRPRLPRLQATRTLSTAHATPGQPVVVRLAITNEGAPIETLLIEDRIPPSLTVVGGQTRMLAPLATGSTVVLEYTVAGPRGSYHFAEVQLMAGDLLGIATRPSTLMAPGQLFVLPEVIRLRRAEIRPRRTRIYAGQIAARQGGPGVEFFGVREYQPGDSARWINARASARHPHTLFVNEFEQERAADVGMILDVRQRSDVVTAAGRLLEYGILAAAALADVFLARGNRVGLLMYGGGLDWTFPGYGKVQRERILRALARAEPGESMVFEDLSELPTRLFPARSQLVLISPLVEDDLAVLRRLRARGYRLLVISPDPIAFERAAFRAGRAVELATRIATLERELLLRRLRQAGIQVVNWRVETPFAQVAHAALSRAPLGVHVRFER